jgi:hypothetical protein
MSQERAELLKETLNFLKGARTPKIAVRLHAFGYTKQVWQEGWELMKEVVDSEYGGVEQEAEEDVIDQLDSLENLWYQIIETTLTRHHPAIALKIFDGLQQTDGVALIASVGTLVERIDALRASKNKDDKAAAALLETRGVDEALLAELRGLLARANSFLSDEELEEVVLSEEQREAARVRHEAALAALRGYLREWTLIARAAIKNKNHLRQLGLGAIGRPVTPA